MGIVSVCVCVSLQALGATNSTDVETALSCRDLTWQPPSASPPPPWKKNISSCDSRCPQCRNADEVQTTEAAACFWWDHHHGNTDDTGWKVGSKDQTSRCEKTATVHPCVSHTSSLFTPSKRLVSAERVSRAVHWIYYIRGLFMMLSLYQCSSRTTLWAGELFTATVWQRDTASRKTLAHWVFMTGQRWKPPSSSPRSHYSHRCSASAGEVIIFAFSRPRTRWLPAEQTQKRVEHVSQPATSHDLCSVWGR